jgi:predicted nucleotidyltransferase
MTKDSSLEKAIDSFKDDCHQTYGDDLVSVIIYGSAASGEYVAGHSDLNFLVVLRKADSSQLEKSFKFIGRWRKLDIVAPLILDQSYIRASTDVFPMEFLDMKENHKLVYGEDILSGLDISPNNLRLQCEQEIKGKMIRLRQIFLEVSGDPAKLHPVMVDSLSSMVVIMRNLLRLKGLTPPIKKEAVIGEVEINLGVSLKATREVYRWKRDKVKPPKGEVLELYRNYLSEVERLGEVVDRFKV